MQISLKVDGGFVAMPQLSKTQSLNTEEIDPQLAHELESIVEASDFFGLPSRSAPGNPQAADLFTYTVTVQDQDRTHTVTLSDPVSDERLSRLIEILQNRPS